MRVEARIGGPMEEVQKELAKVAGVHRVSMGAPSEAESAALYIVEFANGSGRSSAIARAIANRNWDLHELSPVKKTLEDVFIKVVTEEEGGNG